jgi:putative ABC transport system substrate-binding protein
MSIFLRRREFIAGLGGAAVWPLAAHAQQGDRVRRIGVLLPGAGDDPGGGFVTLTQALGDLGWTDGRNVRMEVRWSGADINGYGRSRMSWWACNPTSS